VRRALATLETEMASQPVPEPNRAPRLRRRELALDVPLAVVVFALSLAMLAGRGESEAGRDLDALGVLLAACASLPLVAWRRSPLAVFALTALASAALNGLDYPVGPPLGPTIALFLLALAPERTRAPRWVSAAVVLGLFAVHIGATAIAEDGFPTVPILFGTLVWGGAWVIGDRVRGRRSRIAELEERARRAEREAERERRLATAEERMRIARDLHDSAGHAINVILVQAGAARLLAEQDPERSRVALETIEEVARETLGEIDRLVGALREDGLSSGGAVEPPLGLAALEALIERHRSAGLVVSVRSHGPRRPLPPGLDQAAYRIVQEALTNAARHGGGRADVDIAFESSSLALAVTNPISADRDLGGDGHGIVGMRERAALAGGNLEAGAADGVFQVRAVLPYGVGAE
jgi:signal transduction histidine kinase